MHTTTPIAIVGIGCRFAGAQDLHAYADQMLAGVDGFGPIPADRWTHDGFFDRNPRKADKAYTTRGGFIDDIKSFPAVALQIPPRRLEVMDPQQRLILEVSLQAVADAGMHTSALPKRTGVYVGVTAVEFRTLMASRILAQMMAQGDLGDGMVDPSALAAAIDRVIPPRPFTAPGVLSNMIAATVAQELGLKGPAFTMDAACASSLLAVAQAVTGLRAGLTDVALAGGVYLCLTPEHHVAFSRIGAISPSGRCLPFDARADGFVQGDGAGMVMLKRLDDAEAAGDRIYGIIEGIAVNNDGGGEGPMAPVQSGQMDVIEMAWADAGLSASNLGYVETHGTGTAVGDKTEFAALMQTLGGDVQQAALGSAKANVGHTMSAAGVAGLIRATLALSREVVPPMAHFEGAKAELGLDDSPFFVPTAQQAWSGADRLAAVSSFGFGGTNVHAVVRSANGGSMAAHGAPAPTPQLELVCISAPDEVSLQTLAGRTADALEADPSLTVAGVARAWQVRRAQPARLALVADNRETLVAQLRAAQAGEHADGTTAALAPETPPKIAGLYPGQGAQQIGMLRALKDRFPIIADALAEADSVASEVCTRPISELLYPELRAETIDDEAAQAELTNTRNAQPALIAVGHALTALLDQVGVQLDVVAGHSVGEFTAAVTAEVLPFESGLRWVAARGAAMADHEGDPGAMVALHVPAERAEALLVEVLPVGHDHHGEAIVANHNHPRQVVVSGTTPAVAVITEAAKAAGMRATPLQVSHGFHSPVFADLDLSAVVDGLPLADPQIPLASCIQDHPYADADEARAVFKAHATSPVRFVDTLKQCQQAGAELFLQVGVGGPLASFTRGTLEAGSHKGVLTLSSHKEHLSVGALLLTLGKLWVAGVPVNTAPITGSAPVASVPPEVLPRTWHWGVKREGNGRTTLVGLQSEAKAQTTAQPKTTTSSLAAEKPAASPATAPAPQVDVPAESSAQAASAESVILSTVAQVSAYPLAALKVEMRLMEDLGFDSLMLVDLGEQLVKAIDGLDGLPQELFVNQPRIQDLIDYVTAQGDSNAEANTSTADEAPAHIDDHDPLSRFRPHWVEAPLPTSTTPWPEGLKVAIAGPGVSAAGVRSALQQRGNALVSPSECDVLVWCADGVDQPHLALVVDGDDPAPDPAAALLSTLKTLDSNSHRPDVMVLRDAEDFWAEGLTGVIRALAREWPESRCQSLRFDAGLSAEARVEIFTQAAVSADATVDALFTPTGRFIADLAPAPETAEPFAPTKWGWTVITGGMRSVGLAIAQRLLDAGGMVALVGRKGPSSEAEDLWHTHGERVAFVKADVLDKKGIALALERWHGRVHTMVHCAGVLADGAVGQVSLEAGRSVRAVKTQGWLNSLAACGRGLKRTVAIGSWAGRFGNRHQLHYAAANAQMAAIAEHLPIPAVVSEFGPWTDSTMGQTLSEGVKATMRASGVDFVGTEAGVNAVLADLADPIGVSLRARRVPQRDRRVQQRVPLSVAAHPYLHDHAIGGVPVLPMASVVDLIAWSSAVQGPFEVSNVRLFRGVTVTEDTHLTVQVNGDAARVTGPEDTLHYTATVRPVLDLPTWAAVDATGPVGVDLDTFYRDVTFHGPMLRGLVAAEGAGPDVIRGRVKTGRPSDWMPDTARDRWSVDPLALDSAFQLAAVAAWVQFQRGGTPIALERLVQIAPLPAGEIWAEVRLKSHTGDQFTADVALLDASGALLLLAEGLKAELRAIEAPDQGHDPAPQAPETPATEAPAAEAMELKPEWTDFAEAPEYKDLRMRLDMVGALGLKNPYFDVHQGTARSHSLIDGRDCLNYSSYNYLGYSGDPRVLDAVEAAMRTYGTSVSASRVASGERPFHGELERGLAAAQNADAAVVMGSGHATNVTTIGHLFGSKDLILHDELIHDSCLQGIKLSGAARRSYRHEDPEHLESQLKMLRPHYERVLILTEGVYSMDGDISNTPAFVALKRKYGCLLMVDEAHSFGTVGATGRGVGEHWGLERGDVDIWMGTLSKSLSAMGGWIAGSNALVEYLRYTTPGFVFAAGLPPTLGVAALTSLQLMAQEPERVQQLQRNGKTFVQALTERGIDVGPARGESPVVPVITGNSLHAMHLAARLLEDGINARPIVYPAVADDAARLRFFLCNLHTPEELVHTAERVAHHLQQIRSEI
ncbi:MAG: aminotransferase class I/II-fold pyridoxal phosphate-dependent enzyme [Bradymonadia bacterium]